MDRPTFSMTTKEQKKILDKYYRIYNNTQFIEKDPISIPHRFVLKQDIEIAAFFAAIFAWGQRVTIINKCNELMALMDESPYQFITQHQEIDLKRFLNFKHRTFNATDALYFIAYLKAHYQQHDSLELAFTKHLRKKDSNMEQALIGFQEDFFALDFAPDRTKKHIATPARNSTCKRLNMYLRWMVRQDEYGVDFGLWKNIKMSQLLCPLDVHVERVARNLGLIQREQSDWQTVVELTNQLKKLDAQDPVKYDFALFGYGVNEKYIL